MSEHCGMYEIKNSQLCQHFLCFHSEQYPLFGVTVAVSQRNQQCDTIMMINDWTNWRQVHEKSQEDRDLWLA